MKKIVLLLALLSLASFSQAQIGSAIGKKLKEKASQTINNALGNNQNQNQNQKDETPITSPSDNDEEITPQKVIEMVPTMPQPNQLAEYLCESHRANPRTLKMLANYRTMQQRGVSWQEMQEARNTTVRGMNMILTACQKQIDNLHKDNMLDISTDIDVLEQMLKRDGYTENEITGNKGLSLGARTAAEAQRRSSSVPVMSFPSSGEEDTDASRDSASASGGV